MIGSAGQPSLAPRRRPHRPPDPGIAVRCFLAVARAEGARIGYRTALPM